MGAYDGRLMPFGFYFVCRILTNAAVIHRIPLLLAFVLFRHKRIDKLKSELNFMKVFTYRWNQKLSS